MKTKLVISMIGVVAAGILISTSGIFTPLESDLTECYFTDGNGPPRPCRIVDGWYDALFYSGPLPLNEQEYEQEVCDPGPVLEDGHCFNNGKRIEFTKDFPQFPKIDSLRPEDRLQVRHTAGYTTVEIALSSWEEYNEWEQSRGSEHEPMPPIAIGVDNINPIVFDLLFEMWNYTDYEVSRYNNHLFIKKIQKDYSVPNHHGIHDWLESEYNKQYGEKKDGSFSNHFEFRDNVYIVTMLAAD